jgi:hypothetical protein
LRLVLLTSQWLRIDFRLWRKPLPAHPVAQ